jgi:hypothetical protein
VAVKRKAIKVPNSHVTATQVVLFRDAFLSLDFKVDLKVSSFEDDGNPASGWFVGVDSFA